MDCRREFEALTPERIVFESSPGTKGIHGQAQIGCGAPWLNFDTLQSVAHLIYTLAMSTSGGRITTSHQSLKLLSIGIALASFMTQQAQAKTPDQPAKPKSVLAETKTSTTVVRLEKIANPTKKQLGEAKTAYKEAQKFFRADEFELALPLFQRAYTLSGGKASATMGLAQCERQLQMYDSAIVHFQELLQNKLKASIKTRVQQTLDILLKQQELAKQKAKEAEEKRLAEEKAEQQRRQREADALAAKLKEEIVVQEKSTVVKVLESPWFWVAVGAVAAGAGSTAYYFTRPTVYSGTTDTIFGQN